MGDQSYSPGTQRGPGTAGPNGEPVVHKDDHGDHGDPSAHHASGAVDETPVNNSSIVGWGLAMAVLFFGSAAVLTSVFSRITDDAIDERVLSVGSPALKELRAEEQKRLSTYGYVDKKDKKLVHIPIEEGMKRVIAEAKGEVKSPVMEQPAAPAAPPAPAAPASPVAAPKAAPTK